MTAPEKQQHRAADALDKGPRPELELCVGLKTDVGPSRELNEDYAEYCIPSDEATLRTRGSLFVVADGMGGHQAGEVASREAVKRILHEYYADTASEPGARLVRAIKIANRVVHDYALADPSKAGMGTTLVAAIVMGRQVCVANVGDSRAYVLDSQGLTQITEDHSWVEEQIQAGMLTRQEAQVHPQRNLITRALGTHASVDVDLFEGEIHRGNRLLLCTDGLHGPLTNQQMVQALRSMPPAQAADHLVAQAAVQGGDDNCTILIVQADPPRSPEDEMPTQISAVPRPMLSKMGAWLNRPGIVRLDGRQRLVVGLAVGVFLLCLAAAIAAGVMVRRNNPFQPPTPVPPAATSETQTGESGKMSGPAMAGACCLLDQVPATKGAGLTTQPLDPPYQPEPNRQSGRYMRWRNLCNNMGLVCVVPSHTPTFPLLPRYRGRNL